jgi:glycosyltransferase involved in cell wall biosynthesis
MPKGRRLRVAHVITRMIVGGAQETVLLAASLADTARFESIVVCGPQTGSEGSLHDEVRRRGVELVVLPDLVRQVAPMTDLRVVPALARELRRLAPDVVHTNSSKAGIVGRIAARGAGVPRVLHTVHGWPFHDHQSAPVRRVWQELERRTAPLADRLVVVADADRQKGLDVGIGRPEQYVTVRSGLELSDYARSPVVAAEVRVEMGWSESAPVIGAVNRLSPQKDPLTLVEAFAVVARRRSNARFFVAGNGPLRAQVELRVAELGLSDRVALVGLRDDVPRLLQACDVFVSASRWEGLPRTIIAAMASGVPVVATPANGVVDVVRDGVSGLVAPVAAPEPMGHAVLRLLDDHALRARVIAGAAARVPEFDARTMVRDLERLYDGGAPG